MRKSLVVRADVVIPGDAIEMHAVRASGPGGQNVNKVSSKVELRVDVARVEGLDAQARNRLFIKAGRAVGEDGWLVVTSQETRDQRTNRDAALEKVRALVLFALERPRPRRKTRPTRASVERRIGDKKRRAKTKAKRRAAD